MGDIPLFISVKISIILQSIFGEILAPIIVIQCLWGSRWDIATDTHEAEN